MLAIQSLSKRRFPAVMAMERLALSGSIIAAVSDLSVPVVITAAEALGMIVVGSNTEPPSKPGANRSRVPMIPTAIAVAPAFMSVLVSYFETVLDALTIFPADDVAAASCTTTVMRMSPWPKPQ
jgi:hypothetical protein